MAIHKYFSNEVYWALLSVYLPLQHRVNGVFKYGEVDVEYLSLIWSGDKWQLGQVLFELVESELALFVL